MDLNNIELPAHVVAELYYSSLVETIELPEAIPPVSAEIKQTKLKEQWKWLGENRKKILIVIRHPDFVHLPDSELNFITGMLAACQLSLADVAIVNIDHQPGSGYKEMLAQFNSKIVLLFGVEPLSFQLPINFPQFQVQNFTGSSFLFSPALAELEEDKVLKSKLWVCLRRIFNV